MKYVSALLIGLMLLLFTVACDSGNHDTASITNIIPVVGFSNQGVSRAVVPATSTTNDINYFVYCPAITGFNSSSISIAEGQELDPQGFLSTYVIFTVRSFTDGTNGINNGVRFSGVLTDGSGTVVVELDSAGTEYWFEEKLFLDDPNKIIDSSHERASKTIVYFNSSGSIHSDGSVLGESLLAFYSELISDTLDVMEILAVVPQCELYLGPWDSSNTQTYGSGTVFLKNYLTTSPAASYNGVLKPAGTPDADMIDPAVEYIKAFAASVTTYNDQYALLYKTEGEEHPTEYLDSPWYGMSPDETEITSGADAKAALPSDIWKGYSRLDTF